MFFCPREPFPQAKKSVKKFHLLRNFPQCSQTKKAKFRVYLHEMCQFVNPASVGRDGSALSNAIAPFADQDHRRDDRKQSACSPCRIPSTEATMPTGGLLSIIPTVIRAARQTDGL